MDEQRTWIKSKRKKRLRLLAAILCFCLLGTTYPDIPETVSVFAAGTKDDVVYVTDFAELPEKVREQRVPTGTGIKKLGLPDELEAVVIKANNPPEPPVEETPAPAKETPAPVKETPTPAKETPAPVKETPAPAKETPAPLEEKTQTQSEETDSSGQNTSGGGADEDGQNPSSGGAAEKSEQNPADSITEDAKLTQETHTITMPEYQAGNVITVETIENTQETGTKEETVTIEGITWQSEPEFDGNTEGIYIFTAVLPEGYALMEGVSLPQITVTVQADSADSVIQALLDRIAALPDSEAYLAKEPDTEEEEVYAEWMEGLYQYAGEALDIQEAYEALTEEQQAQIPEEAFAKLTAWVEIAEQIAGNDRVMLAAVTPAPGDVISSDQEWSGGELLAGTYTIQPGVTVTVTDTLLIEGNVNVTINGGGTLKRGFTTGTENGSIIKVDYGGGLILDNVIIDGNNMSTQGQGPAVYIGDGTVTMQNGSVIQNNYNANTGNNGDQAGGGIYCEGTLQIDGGTIKNCSTYDDQMTSGRTYAHAGGAIYLKGTCTMTAGSITGNTANNGGGIYLASTGAELNLKGGTIAGNSVRTNGNGAGIYYSTVNGATSTLVIGGNANVQDVIYLDITSGTMYPYITSSLRHKITLACSEGGKDGRVLLGGEGYKLTTEDARMVSMQNTNLYSRLNSVENKIYLSTVPCGHEDIQKVSAKGATCLAAGNKEYYICPVCGNLFSDSTGSTPTTLEDVTIAQKSHNYTYTANGAVITEKCGNGCGHSATATLTLSSTSLTYTGQPLQPASVKYTSGTWIGTAPTIGYKNNTNVGKATASITVNGETASLDFTITAAEMSGVSASGYTGTYDGTAHGITVNAPAGATVEYGTSAGSYTLPNSPTFTDVGTHTVYYQVTKTNYATVTGSATVKITAADISGATVTLSSTTLAYNGSAQTIGVTSVMIGNTTLTEGTDYTVSGNTGTAAGEYTITITGKGGYGSTKEVTYTIARKSLTADMVSIASGPYYYNGSDITPAVTVKDGGTTLVSGTDYTVSYENNVNVGNNATVTVEGKGNYTGTLSETFTIEYRQLPAESLTNYVTISPELTNGWYGSDITLTPKNGCKVGETPAGTGNSAVTISQETGTGAKIIYIKDADGNIYQTEFSYKLDKTPPVANLTGMTVENGTKNLWDWIIGKKSMIIKIPVSDVTDVLSGVAEVTYTAQPDNGIAQNGTPKEQGGYYQIALNAQFSGTIQLTVKDNAGNTANVSLTADGGKVIAEDYPPVVTFALTDDTLTPNAGGWYNTAVTIKVTVTDNKDNGSADILSGGIAEISWKDGESGTVQTVTGLPGNAPVYDKEFTISVNTDGTHTYYINAVDNAGNESGWQTYTVKADTGKPVFTGNPTAKNPTEGGADITFTSSESGKVYWIVSDGGTTPTAQEVKEQSGGKGGAQDIASGTEGSFTLTGLTPGKKYTVYAVLEDAAGNLSEVKGESFFTRQEAPVIKPEQVTVNYIDETITLPGNIGTVEVFRDSQLTGEITPNADGSLPVTPGTAVYIRYPEKSDGILTTPASDSVKIDIPGRPDKPAAKQVTVTDTTAAVTNPVSGEEYTLVEKGQTPDWTDENNVNITGQFTGLDPNKEYVLYARKKATGSSFASDPVKTEIRTNVTIRTPVITGDGADKSGNTAPKPDTPNADGTVTFTGTYSEEYTPVIRIGSQEYTPEMTWDENGGKGSWEYTYPIPGDATEVESTVEFRKRTLTGIEVTPDALTIYADDAANESLDTLTAYVKANSSAEAVYDNKTSGAVQAAYATTGSFAQKGAPYTYTASAEGKTDHITLTVKAVSAAVTAPDKYMQVQKSGGYTAAEVAAWLPPQVTVTYTGDGYTARTENRTVTWNTASIGAGFGSATGKETISGTVALPAWATGGNSVSIVIEFTDKIVLRDDQIQLNMPGFSYGAQALPNPGGSITVTDTSPVYTYLYSTDGGATWLTADRLPQSDSGYIVPGEYRVRMTYTGDRYTGEKTASFTVEKKALTILPGTFAVQDKNYDGTPNAVLKESGQPVLSGMAAGDTVTLGGSLSAVFTEKGPKKNIPVAVTGFVLEGRDAGYYTIKNETLTLYATINNADGTPPADGGGNGGSSGGGNSGRDDDDDDSDTPEDNNASGTPAITTPVTPSAGTPAPGTDTNTDKNGAGQQAQGTTKEDAKTGDTDNSENGAAAGNADPLKPDAEPGNTEQAGQDSTDSEQTKEKASQTLQASIDGGKLTIAGDLVTTGNITKASETTTILEAGDGAVIVTVVCEEETCTAGVKDTVAVANAVLTPEQIRSVNDGETIEIRVDVKDISGAVPGQDRKIIESGLAEYQKERPKLTLGMYIDISMFIRIGGSGWDAVTETAEPVEVVIGIPEELKGERREFYIIRSHDGAYTLLPDTDDDPDTITVSTNLFSAYAIAYEEAEGAGAGKCGLCHICPTFLGICWFIWLAVIVMLIMAVWIEIVIRRKRE